MQHMYLGVCSGRMFSDMVVYRRSVLHGEGCAVGCIVVLHQDPVQAVAKPRAPAYLLLTALATTVTPEHSEKDRPATFSFFIGNQKILTHVQQKSYRCQRNALEGTETFVFMK